MKDWAVPHLRCPACRAAVEAVGDHLTCRNTACATRHPVIDGVPVLLTGQPDALTQRIQRNFGFEWTAYARFGWDDPEYTIEREREVFHLKSMMTANDLTGRLVLDAGCGNGRYTHWAAAHGARVIAIDVSDAVRAAAANTRDLPNVQVVQADLFNLPFAGATFDVIFSIGTLMCTGDARKAFAGLAGALKPGGLISIHLYGKGNVFYECVDRVIRQRTTRMALPELQRFTARAYRVRGWLHRLGLINSVGKIVRLDSHPHCVFDWYAAPAATHHTYAEVKEWFAERGLDVETTREQTLSRLGRMRRSLVGGPGTVTIRGRARAS